MGNPNILLFNLDGALSEPYMIREIVKNDLDGLLRLYMQLHDNPMPEKTAELLQIWDDIFAVCFY